MGSLNTSVSKLACACQITSAPTEDAIAALSALRVVCPAIQLMLPDTIWQRFVDWHAVPDDVALHRSIILLALQRGLLGRLTSPIHRYLFQNGGLLPSVRLQYLRDLQETWMFESAPMERHRRFRGFFGKVTELGFAESLDTDGWTIEALEAYRTGPDVVARRDGQLTAFEVKYVGTEDLDFGSVLESIGGTSRSRSVSIPNAINYLIFRVFEAAHQLTTRTERRVAVVIIEELTWWRFDVIVQNRWIDWKAPAFVPAHAEWDDFLARQKRHPNIHADLAPTLGSLNELWILRTDEYRYSRALAHSN